MKAVGLFFLSALIIFIQSCKRPCVESSYQFKMTEIFTPQSDSMKVGDTLYLQSNHSIYFTDDFQPNAEPVNFGGSFLGANIRMLEFPDSATDVVGAVPSFRILITNGSEIGNDNLPSENKGFYYQELNSQFVLKVSFVALKKGIYAISVIDTKAITDGKNSCIKAGFEIKNVNSDNHIYYYQSWRPNYIISEYERTHMYCFKVY